MKAITAEHRQRLESARSNLLRQQERDQYRSETSLAKHIQTQTGCTWSQAIAAVLNGAA